MDPTHQASFARWLSPIELQMEEQRDIYMRKGVLMWWHICQCRLSLSLSLVGVVLDVGMKAEKGVIEFSFITTQHLYSLQMECCAVM